jgi:predicted peptidase
MKSGGVSMQIRLANFQQLIHTSVLLFLSVQILFAADDQPAERKGVSRVTVVSSTRLPYLAITPVGFRSQRGWPLILFLHGSEQRGTDLNLVKLNGPPKYALNHPDFPFVVVAPQLAEGKIWNADAVAGLVKQLIPRFKIDSSRIYLTGLSTGGYGTWDTAVKYPERFAAVAPVSGGGNTVILKHAEGAQLDALRALSVWAFHGGSDSIVDPSESQRMIAELQRIGAGDVRVTIYPGAPHDIWNQVYDTPALYDWFLQHQR